MKFKHAFLIAVSVMFISSQLFSQELIQKPKSFLKLSMQMEGGNNGASVAFNPNKNLYYAVFAGNADYPLETFDISGNNLTQTGAGNDMRGLWYNPKTKVLEGNCYADGGIVKIYLDDLGYATGGASTIFEGGDHQPVDQAVGVYDGKKEILYLYEGSILGYSRKNGKPGKTLILPNLPVDLNDLNWSTMIYTGVKNMEIGLLDIVSKKVYFFDRKDGSLTGTVQLPAEAVVYEAFNFSYANGMIFLFDKDQREWTGYKIF